MNDSLSQDQLQAMLAANPMNHQQSAMALGGSNNIISGAINGWQKYTNVLGDVSTGIAKGELSTLKGASDIGQTIARGATQPLIGQAALQTPQEQQFNQQVGTALTPQNTPERIGYTGEKIGEYFAPGGIESDTAAKGASYIDKLPDILGMTGKAAKTLTGTLKTALQGLISGTSAGAVSTAQTGDVKQGIGTGEFVAPFGAAGKALEDVAPGALTAINKAGFRLSPSQEAKTQKITEDAARFMAVNKITGGQETKFSKLSNVTQKLESTLQSSLPKDVQISKQEIVSNIDSMVEQLRSTDPAIYTQARNKADEAIRLINERQGDSIPIKDVLQGKRSWGTMAFKTSAKAKQDPTVSSEGAFAAEQGYQTALEKALNDSNSTIKVPASMKPMFDDKSEVTLPEFNAVYSKAINARNLTGIARFKSDSNLFGRLFGLWAGKSLGQSVMPGLGGEIVGGALGEMVSSKIPGALRYGAEKALGTSGLPEATAKTISGITTPPLSQDQNQ